MIVAYDLMTTWCYLVIIKRLFYIYNRDFYRKECIKAILLLYDFRIYLYFQQMWHDFLARAAATFERRHLALKVEEFKTSSRPAELGHPVRIELGSSPDQISKKVSTQPSALKCKCAKTRCTSNKTICFEIFIFHNWLKLAATSASCEIWNF